MHGKVGFVFVNAWKLVRSIHFLTVGRLEEDDQRDNSARVHVWHTSTKPRQGFSFICVGVEGVSYQTALERRIASAACSWIRTTVPIRLHSAAKPAQQRKNSSTQQRTETPTASCERISYPKFVIYNICQNCTFLQFTVPLWNGGEK